VSHRVNRTDGYHLGDLDGLGWELTVCNSLWPGNSPCRRVLENGDSYGAMLFRFLEKHVPMEKITHVLEVGGGYGFLMKDFLDAAHTLRVTMLDISPFLLDRQRDILEGRGVTFRQGDFLSPETPMPDGVDLVIMNENLGDLPTVLDMTAEDLERDGGDPVLEEVRYFYRTFNLPPPAVTPFNINLGALQAVRKICEAGVPRVFLSEHSCEASAKGEPASLLGISPNGNPERIRLRGHDEYTIRFSCLEAVAKQYGYRTLRGPLADYLPPIVSHEVRFLLTSGASRRDEDEIIRQFIGDLYTYEYLLLFKE